MIALANLPVGSIAWLLLPTSDYEISLTGDFTSSGHVRLDHFQNEEWRQMCSFSCDAQVNLGLSFGEYLITVDGPDRVFFNIRPLDPNELPWMPVRPLLIKSPITA